MPVQSARATFPPRGRRTPGAAADRKTAGPAAPAPARPTDRSIFSPSPIPLSRFSGWRFVRRALASAAHSIAQRRVPCAPGRPLSLMTFYPPGWECQAGRAFAAVRGRTRRRGGLRNAFTNFVAYAAGSDARRTFRRVPAAEARRPAPEALRGQARGTLGGWKVLGCLRGRLWGRPPGRPPGVTPRPCGARRAALALKNASLLICFFRCISSLFPLFAVLNNICRRGRSPAESARLRLSSQTACNGHLRNVIIEPTQKASEQPWNFPFRRSFRRSRHRKRASLSLANAPQTAADPLYGRRPVSPVP